MPFGVFVCRIPHCYSCRCIEDSRYVYNKVSFQNRRIPGRTVLPKWGSDCLFFHNSPNENSTNHGMKTPQTTELKSTNHGKISKTFDCQRKNFYLCM